jgi:ribosomal protein S27E
MRERASWTAVQFCGKIVMQPPGGRTTLNLFG